MTRKAKAQASMLGIIMGVLVLACCIAAIVGVCIDEWTVTKSAALGFESEIQTSFGDYSDTVKDLTDNGYEFEDKETLLPTMVAFGYIAAIAAAALAILYLLKMVLNIGLFRFIVGIGGIATLIIGAILIGVTASYCENMISFSFGQFASSETVIGLGAYLTSIGTMAGGLCAVIGCARK